MNISPYGFHSNQGKQGVVVSRSSSSLSMQNYINVKYDDGATGQCIESEVPIYYKLISVPNKKTVMKTISNFIKKMTDADTQDLLKAGYLNGDLEPTSKVDSKLREIHFFAHKKELVEAAREEIKEAEASEKKG